MISESEKRYLYWLTSTGYSGLGAVVEVGTWLGCSTLHLAAGLRQAGYNDGLYCYDRYVWKQDTQRNDFLRLRDGEDFQPHFERNMQTVFPNVLSTKIDLEDIVWNGGGIEILFLDAPKKLNTISRALSIFGPHLIPNVSLIVLQDYLFFPSFALAAVFNRLGDRVELVHAVEEGDTVTFLVRKPLAFSQYQPMDWNPFSWTKEEIFDRWDQILQPLNPDSRSRLAPALPVLLYTIGEREFAIRTLREMKFSAKMEALWKDLAKSSFYRRYRPLFNARGVRSSLKQEIHAVLREFGEKTKSIVLPNR